MQGNSASLWPLEENCWLVSAAAFVEPECLISCKAHHLYLLIRTLNNDGAWTLVMAVPRQELSLILPLRPRLSFLQLSCRKVWFFCGMYKENQFRLCRFYIIHCFTCLIGRNVTDAWQFQLFLYHTTQRRKSRPIRIYVQPKKFFFETRTVARFQDVILR